MRAQAEVSSALRPTRRRGLRRLPVTLSWPNLLLPSALEPLPGEHLGGDLDHGVGGDGEADPLGAGADGHVDADQLARQIDQRVAAIACVDAGIRLDQGAVAHLPVERHVPPHGADHADGDGVVVAAGVADRHHRRPPPASPAHPSRAGRRRRGSASPPYQSAPSGMPSAGSMAFLSVSSRSVFRFNTRTLPSASTASGLLPNAFPKSGSFFVRSNAISAGFVHGTASVASTTRMVLEVPSGKLAGMRGAAARPNGAFGPLNTW